MYLFMTPKELDSLIENAISDNNSNKECKCNTSLRGGENE